MFMTKSSLVRLLRVMDSDDVLQLSSLLRGDDDANIIIHRRLCDRQPHGSQLCVYYAVAAAISICHGIDPTGAVYNLETMVQCINRVVSSSTAEVVPVECQRPSVDVIKMCSLPQPTHLHWLELADKPQHVRVLDNHENIVTSACNWLYVGCNRPALKQ